MTTGTVKTQGTELFLIDSLTSNAPAIVKMACPTGIAGLGGASDQIEKTCLDTVSDREYDRGLGNPGQVTVPFNLIPTDASHQLLFDLKDTGDTLEWAIGLSDGNAAPTVDSEVEFVFVNTRTYFKFSAYIADVNIDIATNEIVRGTLTLQRSGAVVPFWKGAQP